MVLGDTDGTDNIDITDVSDFLFDDFVETPYTGVSLLVISSMIGRDAMHRVSTM